MVLHVTADSARDMYQTGIGAHVSQSELIRVSSSTHLANTAQSRAACFLSQCRATQSWTTHGNS